MDYSGFEKVVLGGVRRVYAPFGKDMVVYVPYFYYNEDTKCAIIERENEDRVSCGVEDVERFRPDYVGLFKVHKHKGEIESYVDKNNLKYINEIKTTVKYTKEELESMTVMELEVYNGYTIMYDSDRKALVLPHGIRGNRDRLLSKFVKSRPHDVVNKIFWVCVRCGSSEYGTVADVEGIRHDC